MWNWYKSGYWFWFPKLPISSLLNQEFCYLNLSHFGLNSGLREYLWYKLEYAKENIGSAKPLQKSCGWRTPYKPYNGRDFIGDLQSFRLWSGKVNCKLATLIILFGFLILFRQKETYECMVSTQHNIEAHSLIHSNLINKKPFSSISSCLEHRDACSTSHIIVWDELIFKSLQKGVKEVNVNAEFHRELEVLRQLFDSQPCPDLASLLHKIFYLVEKINQKWYSIIFFDVKARILHLVLHAELPEMPDLDICLIKKNLCFRSSTKDHHHTQLWQRKPSLSCKGF